MSKLKLFINTGEIDPEMGKQIYQEVEKYSLTPSNREERSLNVLEKKFDFTFTESEYNMKELIHPIEEKISGVLHTNLNEVKKKDLVADLLKESFVQNVCDINKTNSYIRDFNILVKSVDISQNPYLFESKYNIAVVRHGINIHNTKKIVEDFNNTILKLKEPYGEEIGCLQEDAKSNKSGGSKLKLAFDDNSCKLLHPLESILLADATFNALENKHKSILVDIFERTKDGRIAIDDETNKPKIHTIVLCKKGSVNNSDDLGFLVIDPSNSEFSQHLGMLGVNKIISSLLGKNIQLEVSNKFYKIYEQNSKIGTGFAFNKFRDCIDIAFKLAKDFNKIPEKNITFDINDKSLIIFDSLLANNIVKQITNNKDFDNDIEECLSDKKFLNYPFRGKQLTEVEKGDFFYKNQVSIYKKINEHVKNLPLNPMNKIQVIEDMKLTFNDPLHIKAKPFLKRVDQSITLIQKIDEVFMSEEGILEMEVEFLGDRFEQVSNELYSYYQ